MLGIPAGSNVELSYFGRGKVNVVGSFEVDGGFEFDPQESKVAQKYAEYCKEPVAKRQKVGANSDAEASNNDAHDAADAPSQPQSAAKPAAKAPDAAKAPPKTPDAAKAPAETAKTAPKTPGAATAPPKTPDAAKAPPKTPEAGKAGGVDSPKEAPKAVTLGSGLQYTDVAVGHGAEATKGKKVPPRPPLLGPHCHADRRWVRRQANEWESV